MRLSRCIYAEVNGRVNTRVAIVNATNGLRRLPSTSRIQMATIGESAPQLFPRLEKSPRF